MWNSEERERYFEKAINRWENEGGAIGRHLRHTVEMADDEASDQNIGQSPAPRRAATNFVEPWRRRFENGAL